MRKLAEDELDTWLWGQVALLVKFELATTGEVREAFFRLVESEQPWRQIPMAMRNMENAMPAIHQQTQFDDSIGVCRCRSVDDSCPACAGRRRSS